MSYTIGLERGDLNYRELEPNYRRHHAELVSRLSAEGIDWPDYNPQLRRYFDYMRSGVLRNFVARLDGKAIGHANIYVLPDMHSGETIAYDDMIYVTPEHRGSGVGRKLVKAAMEDAKKDGATRFFLSAVTDPRAAKLWQRMGFRELSPQMIYNFRG